MLKSIAKFSEDNYSLVRKRNVSSSVGVRLHRHQNQITKKQENTMNFEVRSSKVIDQINRQGRTSKCFREISNKTIKMEPAKLKQEKKITVKISKNPSELHLLRVSQKIKLIYWTKELRIPISSIGKLVISADFILNQDNFWEYEQIKSETNRIRSANANAPKAINESVVRDWKILHKQYFVIWTIRRKSSLRKIQAFVSFYNLPLHAVFYIKRKPSYTLDYSPIQKQIQKQQSSQPRLNQSIPTNNLINNFNEQAKQTLIILQTLKINTKDVVTYESYSGKVPILLNQQAKICFYRIQNDPPGLNQAIILSRKLFNFSKNHHHRLSIYQKTHQSSTKIAKSYQIYQLKSIKQYIDQFLESKEVNSDNAKRQQSKQEIQVDQQKILQKIELTKKNIIQDIMKTKGRFYRFQGNVSIQYFVGDLMKRNYQFFYDSFVSEQKNQQSSRKPLFQKDQQSQVKTVELLPIRLTCQYYEFLN